MREGPKLHSKHGSDWAKQSTIMAFRCNSIVTALRRGRVQKIGDMLYDKTYPTVRLYKDVDTPTAAMCSYKEN